MREKARDDAYRRIDRLVGQGKGLRGMVEDGRACGDILIQVRSMRGALEGLEALLLVEHIDACLYSGDAAETCALEADPDARLKLLREFVRRHVVSG